MPRVSRAAVCGIYTACALAIVTAAGGCAMTGQTFGSTVIQGNIASGVSAEPPVLSAEQLALLARRTQREDELLNEPLTAESAAEIALLHNPAVERALETLGMPGFDRLQLAHIVNPAFNGGRPPSTVDTRIEKTLSVNLMTWVIIPALDSSRSTEERTARMQAADEIVALLFAARRAWVSAVAARQSVRYFEDVVAAVEAGREIMEQFIFSRAGRSVKMNCSMSH